MQHNNYIVKGIGGFYYVKTADGIIECKPKGIFRKEKITPLAGDLVETEACDGTNVISKIYKRKNSFVRPPIANVDVFFIVASTVQPVPSTLIIDKLSAVAVDKGAKVVLIITKSDLSAAERLKSCYEKSGIEVIITGIGETAGLERIKEIINGNLCVFCGNSGVGKSTLINLLIPETEKETGSISKKLGRGKHTTRDVELYEAFGGIIADTPGFASLETEAAGSISKENLQFAFPEIEPIALSCKFTGCSHTCEKGCAVIAAVQNGEISQSRYSSYVTMYNEAKQIKDWQKK